MVPKPSLSALLLTATLVSIVGFLCQTISFALDEWLSIGLFLPANTSAFEPPDQDVTITAKFGLWEIGVYWTNGTVDNSTSAKLFHSPSTWTEGAPYVQEIKPELLEEDHSSLLAAEVLVSTGMALCFVMAIGLTLHKFAPSLETNAAFLITSNLIMLFAGVLCIAGAALYLETTNDYCHKLRQSYEETRHQTNAPAKARVDYCAVSFVNIFSIIGGCIELIGWGILFAATVLRFTDRTNWHRLA